MPDVPCPVKSVALLACFLVLALPPVRAQAPETMYRIGVVANSVPVAQLTGQNPANSHARALVEGLRERGWTDGKNIRIHWRSAEDRYDRRPALISELLDIPCDIVVVGNHFALAEAVRLTKSVPIVAVGINAQAAIDNRFIASLARPGGNVTGLSWDAGSGIVGKHLEILKQVAPKASRVAFLIPSFVRPAASDWPELFEPAHALGLTILFQKFDTIDDIETAIGEAARQGANALYVLSWQSFFLRENQIKIQRAAERHRLPAIYAYQGSSDLGGLVTYSNDVVDQYRRAAHFVDRILKGTKPGDIPIELPTKYELVINLKAAKAIGLTVPSAVQAQADRVIE